MSNTFNPEIIVHNGEGLTLTARPSQSIFAGTNGDVDLELKFKDIDIDGNNEVSWKNSVTGREEISNGVFMDSRPPIINEPLDSSSDWNYNVIFSHNINFGSIKNVKIMLVNNNDGTILEKDIDKHVKSFKFDSKDIFENFEPLTSITIQVVIILLNNVKLYSSSVRTIIPDLKIKFLNPENGLVLNTNPLFIETNFDSSCFNCVLTIHDGMSYRKTTENITTNKNILYNYKELVGKIGAGNIVHFKLEIKNKVGITMKTEEIDSIVMGKIVNDIVELVNYLNSGGDAWFVDTRILTDLSFFWRILTKDTRKRDLSDMKYWNVQNVTNLQGAFGKEGGPGNTYHGLPNQIHDEPYSDFNYDITNWNVSNVTNMYYTFTNCANFNQPIGSWDVSNVTDMGGIFQYCNEFNQPLNSWNVSKVTDMRRIFLGANKFNQPLDNWNTANVTNFYYAFQYCYEFNQPLNSWNVSKVRAFANMFLGCSNFNQPLNNWNTSSAVNTSAMFYDATSFNQDISMWNVDNVTMSGNMFINCPIEEHYKPKKNGYPLG